MPPRAGHRLAATLPFGRERGPDDLLELREGDGVVAVRVGEGEHPLDKLIEVYDLHRLLYARAAVSLRPYTVSARPRFHCSFPSVASSTAEPRRQM